MDFLTNITVNTVYIVLLAIGMIYALFLLLAGQLGDLAGGDLDLDLDADVDVDLGLDGGDGSGGLSPVSPLTVATFVTGFGATGLISTSLLGASDRTSILWATLGGLVFAAVIYVGFTYLFIKPQGSSDVKVAHLRGAAAEVITPIPANGAGEIAVIAQGGRLTYSARSSQKKKIGRGEVVRITRVVGGVAYVELDAEE